MSIKVVKAEPRDVYITFEISLKDLKKIVIALDNATINTIKDDRDDPELTLAATYLQNEVFPLFDKVLDDLEEDLRRGP